ncbi:MAG: radical SAM protein, partial [Rhizobiaceae bacterium]
MEPILHADVAASRRGGTAAMANAMIDDSGVRVESERRRGRGAGVNPTGRFEALTKHVFDDGWNSLEELPPF